MDTACRFFKHRNHGASRAEDSLVGGSAALDPLLGFTGRLPGGSQSLVLAEQAIGNPNLTSADKSLVIFLKLGGQIAIVNRHAERSLQTVRAQISKGIDPLQPRAIGEVKGGHRIVELSVLTCASEVGK